jgi:hypothetical protein
MDKTNDFWLKKMKLWIILHGGAEHSEHWLYCGRCKHYRVVNIDTASERMDCEMRKNQYPRLKVVITNNNLSTLRIVESEMDSFEWRSIGYTGLERVYCAEWIKHV